MAINSPLLPTSTNPTTTRSCSILSVFLTASAILVSATALFVLSQFSPTIIIDHKQVSQKLPISSTPPNSNNLHQLLHILNNSISPISNTIKLAHLTQSSTNNIDERPALEDCIDLLSSSLDRVAEAESALRLAKPLHKKRAIIDAQSWLSAVLTNYVTCLDSIEGSSLYVLGAELEALADRASNALASLSSMSRSTSNDEFFELEDGFPYWVSKRDRKLLSSKANHIKANVTVSKDGNGNYSSITEAVYFAPNKTKYRYVIHVRKGVYEEVIRIDNNKKNLMIVGDGMELTIITGNLSVIGDENMTTYNSATLATKGDYFIAQDLCFKNTAGPENHQAVALRVSSDHTVINRCKMDAFQDTLYTHSHRQFYKDCYITGTVDFIFGNGAAVVQGGTIAPRKPMIGQKNMVTAQGRTNPNQTTGISIQFSTIIPANDLPLNGSFPTFLGRPWKNFSRTVVMETYIGDVIDPKGWFEWDGDLHLNTCYYGEYMNYGLGSGLSERVNWTCYQGLLEPQAAINFSVGNFIQGNEWLPSTGVSFIDGI
ncbi:hypothetical protein Sjap_001485 [Stephania japonica]|uniref:Pectinesterase n=1 Tax=Stephania japonica TaxID=461633 RepID=A0AAP0KML3_9MAGN